MTIRRDQDTILLEDVCPVEDAEILMQELLAGATHVDWSGCTELHTACLQVLLASGRPVRGTPANEQIAKWIAPMLGISAAQVLAPTKAELEMAVSGRL